MQKQKSQQGPPGRPPDDPLLDALAVVFGCAAVAFLFHRYAPAAYMDEPFHVPQTQRYCRGDFMHWDPKITTFPGLYVAGAAYSRALRALSLIWRPLPLSAACGTTALRSLNVLLAGACFLVTRALCLRLHPRQGRNYATLSAAVLTLLPTHFFFVFLYYTDVGSLMLVLAAYLASLHDRPHLAALLAAGAVAFRQTNAVWAALVLGSAVLRRVMGEDPRRWAGASVEAQLKYSLRAAWQRKRELAAELWSLALVPAGFAGFMAVNGGVVVGDRAHHSPAAHWAQPLYLLLFAAAAFAPVHLHPRRLLQAARAMKSAARAQPGRFTRMTAVALVLVAYAIHLGTLAHPFLLADNRHYTFYIWKDVINAHPAARYAMAPAYIYSAWSLREALAGGPRHALWAAGLAACTAAVLVPSPLVELRYFTVPAVLVALHSCPPSRAQLLLTAAAFAAVNVATIALFLFRPFRWPDGSVARLMW
ncbi:hypothetical protein WJX81_002842 [Elliptochloris bilobata]|uniref:Dol-P-Glc:Glc(2)Man(9)GlcNAc(2)-PP-Dol alpha-1,2-glucosyltransferase n=1 Tax=Elliptochloris bilobata TaxID=381761 RepID=A0AAW1RCS7_9CHLO